MRDTAAKKKNSATGWGGVPSRQRFILTHPTYLYHVTLQHSDIPTAVVRRFSPPSIDHGPRDAWVNRKGRDLLRWIEPDAIVDRHEARKCPSCGRWFVGAQARILREILTAARVKQCKVKCSTECCALESGPSSQ